ncbi:Putative aminoglycoside phosphotransferase, protein kinase-like domain superfamily [Septoria linicola]|uniref:Aminoglycoside phosphotransferase, protein kinase-like domain superfamily n=1 Tax=Septoria linicola TaxID=215465 RepID=A0A9Q9ENT2_9PEZI|nr:Putative aminoglycoside phosphotransferase, protein kinase-like domain superfamily [Septoria linicola]
MLEVAEVDSEDPFRGISFIPDQTKSPGARRTAFREDPHGILVVGEASVCQIARNEGQVIKSGSRVLAEEGRALQFAHSIDLPVPAVREVRAVGQGATIVMDFVDGECLEEAWPLMGADQKRSIAEQVRDIITTMRQATPNQNTIGACGGPARDCRRYADYSGGPFNNEAEFNEFVLDSLQGTPSLIRSTISDTFNVDNRIVFTHGDLSSRNLIVKEGHVQALLDWEFSGWYPEYWEYTIFDTRYSKELLTYQALARWQRP